MPPCVRGISGATDEEIERPMPLDDRVARPTYVTNRAVRPERVEPCRLSPGLLGDDGPAISGAGLTYNVTVGRHFLGRHGRPRLVGGGRRAQLSRHKHAARYAATEREDHRLAA